MLLALHKDMTVISMTSTQWGRCGLLLTSICCQNCKSVLTRFFLACEWGTSGIMLSNACEGKKWCETLPLSQSRGARQDFLCHCLVSEYCHVCDAITFTYIGKCDLTVDRGDEADAGILLASCRRKTQFSFKQTSQRQIEKKYRTEWCVCALTARGLDMRSKDWRMRLAVALVTPQGWTPAGLALICLLTGACRSE